MRIFYKYAPLIFALFGMLIGLAGYYLEAVLQLRPEKLLWAGIALLLSVAGLSAGRMIRRLAWDSYIDSVTGLWNRRYFYLRLVEEANRKKAPLCVAMIDIDNFKMINDKYGHFAGDLVLAELAAIFKDNVRQCDIVTRWGGDEFAIIFPGVSLQTAYGIMERIRCKVEARFYAAYGLAISAGVVSASPDQGVKDFLLTADRALYKAKSQKNLVIAQADFSW